MTLYRSMMRPPLEYLCTVRLLDSTDDTAGLEKAQHMATEIIKGLHHLSHTEKQKTLRLFSLGSRELSGHMINVNETGHKKTVEFTPRVGSDEQDGR